MKQKNVYELDSKGRMAGYNINLDTERFSFLSKESSFFEQMTRKVNSILNGMVAEKEYSIDWKKVVDEYLERGVGDVPHFANQFVLNNYVLNVEGRKKMKEQNLEYVTPKKEILQAIYLEIINSINGEIDKGNLPGSSEDLKTS